MDSAGVPGSVSSASGRWRSGERPWAWEPVLRGQAVSYQSRVEKVINSMACRRQADTTKEKSRPKGSVPLCVESMWLVE